MSSTITRLLTGIMNQSMEVHFVVKTDTDEYEADGKIQDQSDSNIQVKIDYNSLRDAITQPHKIVVIPGYFRRCISFLRPTLASIVVVCRQVMYLSTHKDAVADQQSSTSPQQVANWAGIDRTTLWRQMKDHRLRWFLKRVDDEDHIYEFVVTMPLTPGDAQLLHDWLFKAGARDDPISTLNTALEAPLESIWPHPPPSPKKDHLEMEPSPRIFQAVVLGACGNIKASLFEEVSALADQLAAHLMPPQELAGLIERAYNLAVDSSVVYCHAWRSGNQAWDVAMTKTDPERLRSLAERLGIAKM